MDLKNYDEHIFINVSFFIGSVEMDQVIDAKMVCFVPAAVDFETNN